MRQIACTCGRVDVTHSDVAFYEGPFTVVHGEHHCFYYPHNREAKIAVDAPEESSYAILTTTGDSEYDD